MNLKKGSWYVVTWRDAFATIDVDWTEPKDITVDPEIILTAGKVVKKTKTYITLAQSVDTTSGRISSLMSIPIGMIVKARLVRVD